MIKLAPKIIRFDDKQYIRLNILIDSNYDYDECELSFYDINNNIILIQFVDSGSITKNRIILNNNNKNINADIIYYKEIKHIRCNAKFVLNNEIIHQEHDRANIDDVDLIKDSKIQYFLVKALDEQNLFDKLKNKFSAWNINLSFTDDEILLKVLKSSTRKTEMSFGTEEYLLNDNDFIFTIEPGISELKIPFNAIDFSQYPENSEFLISEIVKTNINDNKYKTTISNNIKINDILKVRSFASPLSVIAGGDFLLDKTQNITQTAFVTGGQSPFSYVWEETGDGVPLPPETQSATFISGKHSKTVVIKVPCDINFFGSTEFTVFVTDANFNTASSSFAVTCFRCSILDGDAFAQTGDSDGTDVRFVYNNNIPLTISDGSASFNFTGWAIIEGTSFFWSVQLESSGDNSNINISNNNNVSTTMTFSQTGVYLVRLDVSLSTASCSSLTRVTVSDEVFPPLSVDAGVDQTIDPPGDVSLTGVALGGKSPYSFLWEQISGSSTTTINYIHGATASPARSANIHIDVEGSWIYRVTVTDDLGSTAFDEVAVSSVNAASPLSITISGNPLSAQVPFVLSLTGSASGGTSPYSYVWSQISGPTSQISNVTSSSASVNIDTGGNYTYQLQVTDSDNTQRSSSIIVFASTSVPTQALSIDAGTDRTVEIPATLLLSATASGGTAPYKYFWSFSSGPPGAIPIVNNSDTANASAFINQEGEYVFIASVTDNAAGSASQQVTITASGIALGWPNKPGGGKGDSQFNTECGTPTEINADNCESVNNQSICRLSSGKVAIVYESRNKDGQTGISMSIFDTTVQDRIFYYRKLSFGSLLNDEGSSVYGKSNFEIYEDIIVLTDSNNVPIESLQIGFLNGPLAFELFNIETIIRDSANSKYTIALDVGRVVDFENSNNIYNISWFLLSPGDTSIPISSSTKIIISPEDGPVINPSIYSALNNIMSGQDEHVFIAYQKYINNEQWHIGFKHFILSDQIASDPHYQAPYDTINIVAANNSLVGSPFSEVIYKHECSYVGGNDQCSLFSVWLPDGRRVYNCSKESGDPVISSPTVCNTCASGKDASLAWVYVWHPGSTCGQPAPTSWLNTSGIQGSYPPTASLFNDVSCGPTFIIHPNDDVNDWCYFSANSDLLYLIDDPYVPQPNAVVTYHPENLYVLKTGDNLYATRVVYHMSVQDIDEYGSSNKFRVFERDVSGYDNTFIKPAEIIITYNGDLSDKWTNNKEEFLFTDLPPSLTGTQKGLNNFPFSLYSGMIYGIDQTHLNGQPQNWAYSNQEPAGNQIKLIYPDIGFISENLSPDNILQSSSIQPKIKINNRNDVFIAYESFNNDINHINIRGTGDFYQNSITGSKGRRITRLLTLSDFQYSHSISTPGEGINQLCDFVIDKNDVIHITWQSNRDGYWEIYYANSYDLFNPVRITKSKSKSEYPTIDVHDDGDIFIVYHDDRFGPFQIMMAEKNEQRILPLLQQDAYLASLKSGYTHYVNSLTIPNNKSEISVDPLVITIEFYDNKNMDGTPYLIINSQDNMDAFEANEYTDVIIFNAIDYRPGLSNSFKPYGFAPNQTYFPKIHVMKIQDFVGYSDNQPVGKTTLLENYNVSFSCSSCRTNSGNIFEDSACSYSFNITNNFNIDQYYNFEVSFYSDSDKTYLIKTFNIKNNNNDLSSIVIKSSSGNNEWTNSGLLIKSGKSKNIIIYPSITKNSGFVCGILYYVSVKYCSSESNKCTTFSPFPVVDETFYCDCSSNIFNNKLLSLSDLNRWKSSGNGYSDTRVSDTSNDNFRPSISVRDSGLLLISWENYENINPQILMAAYNRDELHGSGSGRLFDFAFNLDGKNIKLINDLYDRMVISNETINTTTEKLPSNDIRMTLCDFIDKDLVSGAEGCDITQFEENIISSDPFIDNQIIKKIIIKKEFIEYFTYNSSWQIIPVVSTCNIELQIHGTPEVIAYRIRNENNTAYTEWIPWSPSISDYYTELNWQLSPNSGIKSIIVQSMTYNGMTNEFSLPVIGDYKSTGYTIELLDADNDPLPKYEGLPVASTKGNTNDNGLESMVINVNIRLDQTLKDKNFINFDVVQQGENDQFNLRANQDTTDLNVYKGSFTISKEDNMWNKDGLAQIVVKFDEECNRSSGSVQGGPFQKDIFNIVGGIQEVAQQQIDILSSERNSKNNLIGKGVVARPSDKDPHLIFGDPNYYLTKNISQKDKED